jgi:ABC-2 type transport system ATP-binding protein
MLSVTNLWKRYTGASADSLKGVTFSIEDGDILGLIGLNGAGKSTLIKSITGVFSFNRGDVFIDGVDMKANPIEAKKLIGFVPDDHSIYENLTGREYCNFIADIYGVSVSDRNTVIDKYVPLFRLDNAFDSVISSYSHGMKQKICLIGSLVHSPKIWILDEPMVGLDPQSMRAVKSSIADYVNIGHNVIFSSHDIPTAQKICNKIAIIHNGELLEFMVLERKPGFSLERYFFKRIKVLTKVEHAKHSRTKERPVNETK